LALETGSAAGFTSYLFSGLMWLSLTLQVEPGSSSDLACQPGWHDIHVHAALWADDCRRASAHGRRCEIQLGTYDAPGHGQPYDPYL